MGDAIEIHGLNELVRSLRKVDRDLAKAMRLALNEAANLVVDVAVPGIPKRTGRAAKAVKARSTSVLSRVIAGSARVAYYPWLDFGGEGRKRGRPPRREFRTKGRYIYVAYFGLRDAGQFGEVLQRAVLNVVRRAGLEVD